MPNGLKRELLIFTANLNGGLSGLDKALELYFSEKMGPPEQMATVLKQLSQLVSGMLQDEQVSTTSAASSKDWPATPSNLRNLGVKPLG
jgi:hypothetical protein